MRETPQARNETIPTVYVCTITTYLLRLDSIIMSSYDVPSLDNVSTSMIPFVLGSRVADIVARATTCTSSGGIPAPPTKGRLPPSVLLIFAIVEIIPFTSPRCGRSWFENINPDCQF